MIKNNDVHNSNRNGIYIASQSLNTFENNNLTYNNQYSLVLAGGASVCNQNIYDNNTGGNGKAIKYYHDTSGVTLENVNNYSEIILCNVSNSLLDNITIDNNGADSDGILVINTSNTNITNSIINNVNRQRI